MLMAKRSPRSRHVARAIRQIAATDAGLARREAKRVLDSGRSLPDGDRKALEQIVKSAR